MDEEEEVSKQSRNSAVSASSKIYKTSKSRPQKDHESEIATICFCLDTFKDTLLAPIRKAEEEQKKKKIKRDDDPFQFFNFSEFERCLKNPSLLSNRKVISDTIKILLEPFRRRKKITDASWCYLLRRIIDSNIEDFGSKNPMICPENKIVNENDVKDHPFFCLSIDNQIKIIYWLCIWILETDAIKQEIDLAMKVVSKGVRPPQASIRPVGTDRNKNKIFHLPSSTRIYLIDQAKSKTTILSSSLEELETYVNSLNPNGTELALKKYFTNALNAIKNEIAEQERKKHEAEVKAWRKEQKRLEFERLLLEPRRSDRRAKGDQKYAQYFDHSSSGTDEDDLIMYGSADEDGDASSKGGASLSTIDTERTEKAEEEELELEKSVISSGSSAKENLDEYPSNPKVSKPGSYDTYDSMVTNEISL